MVLCKSIFTINRIAFTLVFVLACSFTTCVRSIRHDQDSAAQRAVDFARAAMIQRDYSLAYQQLSPKWRKELTVEALKDLVNRMHPTNWPRTIAATEYEPLPGRQAMKIFLYAREHGEDFVYTFVMEGTADTGYKVSGVFRLPTPQAASPTRRQLPVQESTGRAPDRN